MFVVKIWVIALKFVCPLFDQLTIPANSRYFGGRLPILTSNLCKIDIKHNFFIIYNFKNLIIAPNRVG